MAGATATFAGVAAIARPPELVLSWEWVTVLVLAMLALLVGRGLALWRTTRFS